MHLEPGGDTGTAYSIFSVCSALSSTSSGSTVFFFDRSAQIRLKPRYLLHHNRNSRVYLPADYFRRRIQVRNSVRSIRLCCKHASIPDHQYRGTEKGCQACTFRVYQLIAQKVPFSGCRIRPASCLYPVHIRQIGTISASFERPFGSGRQYTQKKSNGMDLRSCRRT